MKIAFLGLGKMGSAMASCLAKSHQFEMVVWNRSRDKMLPFIEWGCQLADKPEEAVVGADVVITSLLDDHSVEALFYPNSPVLNAMKKKAIHLCVTTISPNFANRLQDLHQHHDTRYLSGPVIGRPDVAEAGELVQFLASNNDAFAEVLPIVHHFTAQVKPLEVVAAGVANSQKLCLNFFAAAMIEVLGECFTLGEKLGVSRENLAFFFDKALPAPALNVYVEKLFKRQIESDEGFTMIGGRKDLSLMLQAAKTVNCPLDIAQLIANKMDSALAQGMAELDWSATQEITRQRAGL
ncbi:hypothetical protein BKK52_10145 [Rodentibacter trehalosifermentans]|uniref:6-phosphogluconate dehydrogenase n=1 Tax=Rodentibacter trehalosifermentans TaxID=1908263 RepID=A0A1V3IXQ2_9PAST|nr:NAD(P)-dependent oxidoreductase [Rodentibacter trehalosifermentans]OOF47033.1 hypothetical protein BKK52_10145 [Rodentibacter trehalosifermentans]